MLNGLRTCPGHVIVVLNPADEAWGAEKSLLLLAANAASSTPLHLVCKSAELAEEWRSTTGGSAKVLPRARQPRVLRPDSGIARMMRALSFLPHVLRFPRGTTFLLWDIDLLLLAFLLRGVRGATWVLDLHTVGTSERGRKTMNVMAKSLDGVVCISKFTAQQVPNSIRKAIIGRPVEGRTYQRSTDCLTVAIVGRVDRQKRIEFGIEAFARVTGPAKLAVIGAGFMNGEDYTQGLLADARRRLGARFEYRGRKAINCLYDDVDILLFTNPSEPSGRVIREAQLAGIAVVVPDAGGGSEQVCHGVTGLIYEQDSPASASTALQSLIDDPSARRVLGERGRLQAEHDTDPVRLGRQYFATLDAMGHS